MIVKVIHKRLKDEGRTALENIICENYDAVYQYCFWKVHNAEDAQDITQEVFYRFIHHGGGYQEKGKIRAYLYTIARNLCVDWSVQNGRYQRQNLPENITAADPMESSILKMDLKQLTDALPEEQREILLLRFGQELSVEEIAGILNTNRFAVYYQMKLALARLRKNYERE